MLRRTLLAASASPTLRRIVTTAPVARDVVARFVAGDTADDALRATRRLQADGLLVTLDYLGEDTVDPEQAVAVTEEYVRLLGLLAGAGLAMKGAGEGGTGRWVGGGRAEVSVKPTAVGLGLRDHGEKTARENIARIATAAREAGTTVTVDMEDHTRVDQTLQILGQLRPDFPDLGCVIQSYLRRSPEDCRRLATAGSRVRLCKGAYSAGPDVAFTAKADVDRCYARCLQVLMAGPGYPMIATHDPRLIKIAGVRADLAERTAGSFEYQMLYGIRPAEQLRLARSGAQVRVYLPYGQDWYGYLVRRLAERPANLAFFLRSLATRR
ncbi:MAG TPA: proline dehydrogenase family protein [Streptosporangiaceae bacterium]